MPFTPNYWTTTVGSFPFLDAAATCRDLIYRLDIPAWPQLPRLSFRENMYVQYTLLFRALY